MAITTNRNKYIPFHTTKDVADALWKESQKTKTSVSRLIHEAVRKALQKKGYKDVTGYEYKLR